MAWELGHDLVLKCCNVCRYNRYNTVNGKIGPIFSKETYKTHGCAALDRLYELVQNGAKSKDTSEASAKIRNLAVLVSGKKEFILCRKFEKVR